MSLGTAAMMVAVENDELEAKDKAGGNRRQLGMTSFAKEEACKD